MLRLSHPVLMCVSPCPDLSYFVTRAESMPKQHVLAGTCCTCVHMPVYHHYAAVHVAAPPHASGSVSISWCEET